MQALSFLLDLIVHIEAHLRNFADAHGAWVYALVSLLIFIETACILTPFMPGDSLLFVVGTLCGLGTMKLPLAITVLTAAAIAGNQCGYAVGRFLGAKVFRWEHSRYFDRHAFDATHNFYQRHGGVTIVIARFIPLLRAFAPFVAGAAQMGRARFTFFDVTGGALWVVSLCLAGYLFGDMLWVQQHLDRIILTLLGVTILMALGGSLRGRIAMRRRRAG
jgi:membrane-associated protein